MCSFNIYNMVQIDIKQSVLRTVLSQYVHRERYKEYHPPRRQENENSPAALKVIVIYAAVALSLCPVYAHSSKLTTPQRQRAGTGVVKLKSSSHIIPRSLRALFVYTAPVCHVTILRHYDKIDTTS